jgi:hypothetical protein
MKLGSRMIDENQMKTVVTKVKAEKNTGCASIASRWYAAPVHKSPYPLCAFRYDFWENTATGAPTVHPPANTGRSHSVSLRFLNHIAA